MNKLFQSMWQTQGNRCSLADTGEAAQQRLNTGINASKVGNVGMVGVLNDNFNTHKKRGENGNLPTGK